jgi:ParB family chromosome partitioning protein
LKIDIEKIEIGRFSIREETDQEYLERLTQSLLDDGQWHPVIVRPIEGGRYQLISGHYRLQASKKAGFKEIEANIRDLTDEEADLLSLKTNMLRHEMTTREQGRVLKKIMEQYGWSQREIARKLSVEDKWVGRRLRVALDLHEEVAKSLDTGKINFSVASVIGGVALEKQPNLLNIIIEKGITNHTQAGSIRRQYLNDTIYTVGYQDLDINNFTAILKDNNIESLIDIRYSSESQLKPEYSGKILKRELNRININYEHKPEFGIPPLIKEPFKEGSLSYQCLKQWYEWHIEKQTDFEDFIAEIKNLGKIVLMGVERYAKPKGDQKIECHRDILADLIINRKIKDPILNFDTRIDL